MWCNNGNLITFYLKKIKLKARARQANYLCCASGIEVPKLKIYNSYTALQKIIMLAVERAYKTKSKHGTELL